MKVYLIQHTFNEAYKTCRFFATDSVFSSKKKANEYLEKIKSEIENGESTFFPGQKLSAEQHGAYCDSYTFPWISDSGEQMYTHFYIVEKVVR